ncbi:MAG: peptide deformylase [Spirochaetes bacterium GWD1_61_31]|nr:MAG: peptide deformylase [Spirochaetes bacterium GWB1_60_80]OHD35268.1 MAG: peptide deformylase [Spirochaetes bacterium GWC1_61_12]OHD36023.1 MAG: peptide deformylase [Spirochaetes bacterium GWD1_61_31]OHD42220.1 MAG: peptide deformylase [Spirochaetes bacterium GWE1_60_18]OHD57974.1 MAG: peptide deformylase [Spirochaetes bacterium GWF1_60_12]HAP44393.1 peptide deformylase [Spirochaetaceae bacterium]
MFDIYTIGAEVLRQTAVPVSDFNDQLRSTIEAMFVSMERGHGIGLAAPQIGISQRFFIIKIEGDIGRTFINPELVLTSPELVDYEEGCLSIPGVYAKVNRPGTIKVQAWNEKGRPFNLEADGLLARVIQHELDHLNGVLFTDRLSERVRQRVLEQYEKRMRA